jgi:hypothetical protein
MAKLLAAVSLGTIALVLPTFGASFAPIGTDVTKRVKTSENSTINRSFKTDRLAVSGSTVVVKTIAIRSPAFGATHSKLYVTRPLTDCEPVISPLADKLSGWRIRECST